MRLRFSTLCVLFMDQSVRRIALLLLKTAVAGKEKDESVFADAGAIHRLNGRVVTSNPLSRNGAPLEIVTTSS